MNKKIVALLLALLCAFTIVGCGKKTDTPVDTAPTETTSVEVEYLTQPETIKEEASFIDNESVTEESPVEFEAESPLEIATLEVTSSDDNQITYETFDWSSIPDYSGQDVITINGDVPFFTAEEKVYNGTYINLSELDELGRCQVAMACLGQETEPTEKRGDISRVHPSGWNQLKMSNGEYLYNRSHLLMFALTGLNDDDRNLITGTEYFNQSSMLGYESMALWVIDNANAHVVYRVTPIYDGDNLVAKGVLMEAYCIEYPENCEFCVFVYNVEPGISIDYSTGIATEL